MGPKKAESTRKIGLRDRHERKATAKGEEDINTTQHRKRWVNRERGENRMSKKN